jgi:hypothetical protein
MLEKLGLRASERGKGFQAKRSELVKSRERQVEPSKVSAACVGRG